MLVIGRFPNESIILRDKESGRRIAAVMLIRDGRTGRPRLGITAGDSIAVYREEIDPGDPPAAGATVTKGNPEQIEPS